MYGCGKDCLILIPFRWPQVSCFPLSLNACPLTQLPWCGDQSPPSVPPPAKIRSSPTNTPVFPPSSFILPSFTWFYIFFSTGQVLLSTLSWYSACTSVTEGVFLMYLVERCNPRPPTPPPSLLFESWDFNLGHWTPTSHEVTKLCCFVKKEEITNLYKLKTSGNICFQQSLDERLKQCHQDLISLHRSAHSSILTLF